MCVHSTYSLIFQKLTAQVYEDMIRQNPTACYKATVENGIGGGGGGGGSLADDRDETSQICVTFAHKIAK
jgi:hypothetical protein